MELKKQQTPRSQAGFTLIEIAVVLVIIGLLLGGVLQGQQLIENSRVKSATNDFNGIAAAAFSYQDRYGRLPGDDPNVGLGRGSSWSIDGGTTAIQAGDGDGIIESANGLFAAAITNTDENALFFQHMRAAGFIQGDATQEAENALPANPFGGLTSVTTQTTNAMSGTKVCMSNVGGSAAIALDTQLDDSNPDNGRLRATDGVAGANTEPDAAIDTTTYSEDEVYTICYRI